MSNKELVEQASIKSTVTIDKPPGYLNEKDGSSYHSKASKHAIGDDEDVESLQHGTQRGLSARHIQMISLGGSIG
jgi:amino acid permease